VAADFGVYFVSDQLPTLAAWEQVAAELGVRLRVMPVDLRKHSGVLPVAFEADDYNTGFEFQLTRDWGRDAELAEMLREKDCFGHFRCFNREFSAAVWAAVSFAKACGGVFQDPMGRTFWTFDEALAFARAVPVPGPEFFFQGEVVGLFFGVAGPRTPGPHRFEPVGRPGYSKMNTLLREGGSPVCYYECAGVRVSFTVKNRPYSDVLELDEFEITRLGAAE
jgi:hypothetical protein